MYFPALTSESRHLVPISKGKRQKTNGYRQLDIGSRKRGARLKIFQGGVRVCARIG